MNLELIKLPQAIETECRRICFHYDRHDLAVTNGKIVVARTDPIQYPHTMFGQLRVPVPFISVFDRLFKIVTMEDIILNTMVREWDKDCSFPHNFQQGFSNVRRRYEVLIDTFPKEPAFQAMHDTAMEYEAQCVLLLGAQRR